MVLIDIYVQVEVSNSIRPIRICGILVVCGMYACSSRLCQSGQNN